MTTADNALRLVVRLTPKAARNAVTGWARDAAGNPYLKAAVTAAPDKGKANRALIELLSKEWDIPKSSIELVRGETDRNKVLLIRNPPASIKASIP